MMNPSRTSRTSQSELTHSCGNVCKQIIHFVQDDAFKMRVTSNLATIDDLPPLGANPFDITGTPTTFTLTCTVERIELVGMEWKHGTLMCLQCGERVEARADGGVA